MAQPVRARFVFALPRYQPGKAVERLGMPLLVCVADRDRETPADFAARFVERAPRGELRRYPDFGPGGYPYHAMRISALLMAVVAVIVTVAWGPRTFARGQQRARAAWEAERGVRG